MKKLVLFLIIACPAIALAQNVHHHGVFWGRLILSDTISSKWKWELYLQKRTQDIPTKGNIFGASHFFSIWPWVNYRINKNLRLSISPLGYFESWPFLSKPGDEDLPGIKEFRWVARLEQEQKLKFLNYSNRYSLEYRRRDLYNNNVYLPNWRVRYQARLEKPVFGIFSKSRPVSFSVSDEIFVQFGKAVKNNPNVFDQNRLTIGAAYEVAKNIKLGINYLNIYQERNSGKEFDEADTLWVVLTFDNLFSQFKKGRLH